MNSLLGKITVVTGGNGLIGLSIVQAIRDQGGIAIIADLNVETDLESFLIKADTTSPEGVKTLIDAVIEKFGKVDGWVNNAYPRTKDWGLKVEDLPYESWQKNIDLQLNSYYLCCRMIMDHMKIQQSGSIVNIASIYGVVGPDFSVYEGTENTMPIAYSAIKGGLINLSRYLAAYLGPYNIRVNCVSPGGIFDNQNTIFVNNYEKKVPLRRMGKPSDIGAPVAFMLSDDASYITGHNLMIDGGWTSI